VPSPLAQARGAQPQGATDTQAGDTAQPAVKAPPAADAVKFFQYEIEGGLVTIDEVRKAKGLPPIKDGHLTLPQYRAKYQQTFAESTVAQASGTAAVIAGLDMGASGG
jgi:hypothetical protein